MCGWRCHADQHDGGRLVVGLADLLNRVVGIDDNLDQMVAVRQGKRDAGRSGSTCADLADDGAPEQVAKFGEGHRDVRGLKRTQIVNIRGESDGRIGVDDGGKYVTRSKGQVGQILL